MSLGATARLASVSRPGESVVRSLGPLESVESIEVSVGSNEGSGQALRITIDGGTAEGALRRWHEGVLKAGGRGRWHRIEIPLEGLAVQDVVSLRLGAETEVPSSADRVLWGDLLGLGPDLGPDLGLDSSARDRLPNVLFVILDTLRADRMSLYGAGRKTTPFLDRWAAEEAIVFEQVVAGAPWTLPATTSMLTGLDAIRHGVNHQSRVPDAHRLLPEVFRDLGYRTGAVTAGGYLLPQFGFDQGFDSFTVWSGDPRHELAKNLERAKTWLGEHASDRFFLLFHTYEIHGPHRRRQPYFSAFASPAVRALDGTTIRMDRRVWAPDELQEPHDTFVARTETGAEHASLSDAELELVEAMYDSAIAYTDRSLEGLLAELKRLGAYDDTLIVVTSDHGEALGEGGRAGHNSLDDFNLLVPLVIRLPDGMGAGTRIAQQVRQVDIAPTVLAAIGEVPARWLGEADGRVLAPLAGAGTVPAEAWAYAGAANGGLALRHDGRWKARVNNTADRRLLGQGEVEPIGDRAGSARDLARARLRTERYVEDSAVGLGIEIVNRTHGWLATSTLPDWGGVAKVKSGSWDCRCVDWRAGRYDIRLAPGEDVSLVIEDLHHRSIQFRIEARESGRETAGEGAGRPLDIAVMREHLDTEPRGWSFRSKTGWSRAAVHSPVEEGELRVTLGWRGRGGGGGGGGEANLDEAARRQLEALGYL